jgi:putative PIG3 family NAD(P)H quinone oxidoreductase
MAKKIMTVWRTSVINHSVVHLRQGLRIGRNVVGMYAISITEPGGPEVLQWTSVPDAVAGPGEVLVKVVATAVNRADVLQRKGFYEPPAGSPVYPGLECSGRIVALGEGVEGWQVGQEVCALLAGGGYAQYVAVPTQQLLAVPDGLDLITAAALPEVAATVWSNVVLNARLKAGETILLHGGASGIGTHAIQVAKALGARVIVTAGSDERLVRCGALGADLGINYKTQDFVKVIDEFTSGRGVDVILDVMGGSYLARNVDCLAIDGRLVVIGLMGGAKAELNIAALLSKRASVAATNLRGRTPDEKGEILAALTANLWPVISAGTVRPIVDRVLPITEAAEAHRLLEAGEVFGKLVMTV